MFVRASMYEFAWRCGKGEEGGGLAILCSSPRSKFGIPFESDPHPSIVSDGDESLNDRFRRWLRIAGPLDCDQLRHASMRKRARNERKRGRVPFRVSPLFHRGSSTPLCSRGFGRGKFRSFSSGISNETLGIKIVSIYSSMHRDD